jgi:hypothetical protein
LSARHSRDLFAVIISLLGIPRGFYIFILFFFLCPSNFSSLSKIVYHYGSPAHRMCLSGELATESGPETLNEGARDSWEPRRGSVLVFIFSWRWYSWHRARCAVTVYYRPRIILGCESPSDSSDRSSPVPNLPAVMDTPSEIHAVARHHNALAADPAWYSA